MDMQAAVDLIRALDHIPLAVTQATAYINRRRPRVTTRPYPDGFFSESKQITCFAVIKEILGEAMA